MSVRPTMTPALMVCLTSCANNVEFVANWTRLRGVEFPRSAIDQMIDDATGRSEETAWQFVADVKDLVLDRLP